MTQDSTFRINLKWMATQFLRENHKLADEGETCVFIDEPGYCGRSAAAWGLLWLLRNATKAELVVEGLDDDEVGRLIQLLKIALDMDVGP
jgi:hypothetical protein